MSRLFGPDGKRLPDPPPANEIEEVLLRAYDKLCADAVAGIYGGDEDARVRALRASVGLETPSRPLTGLAAWLPP